VQLKYRPEIDGLRAVAVLAVLAYHLDSTATGLPLLPGGFLGVDVFFVISGFLITSVILASSRDEGGFSYARFYERRARRLLPALLVVVVAALPLAWLLLPPQDLVRFAQSALASLAFGSNFFWHVSQQEYAAASALLQPLLHTWSLAVEEQFYLLFPLLFLAAWRRWPARAPALLLGMALLSIGASEATATRDASAAFYLLPSRLWELLVGAWLALHRDAPASRAPAAGAWRALPAIGVALIVTAMTVPGWHSAYPGLKTLLPVFGTVLVLGWTGRDPATRLLASPPMVGIGLVSYSLYLWHFPVYAFGRHWNPQPGVVDKLGWVAISLVLAALSWWLVERPGRDRRRVPLRRFLAFVLALLLVVVVACVSWITGDGFGGRQGYLESVLQRATRAWTAQGGVVCHGGGSGRQPVFPLRESCVFVHGRAADTRTLVLVGDSNAAMLAEDLRRLAEANAMNFVQLTQAGCAHVPGSGDAMCQARADQLRAFVAAIPRATVVYNARVPYLLEGSPFDNGEGDREGVPTLSPAEREARFPGRVRALLDTLEGLAAASEALVIVYPVPEQGFSVGDKLFAARWRISGPGDLPTLSTSLDVFRARVRRSHEALDRVRGANVVRVHPEHHFCRPASGRCVASEGERIYFASDNHLSPLGSSLVVADIARALRVAPASRAGAK
jgi:peptidoglycan/LPS O-acetylase OafA/YrhL